METVRAVSQVALFQPQQTAAAPIPFSTALPAGAGQPPAHQGAGLYNGVRQKSPLPGKQGQ